MWNAGRRVFIDFYLLGFLFPFLSTKICVNSAKNLMKYFVSKKYKITVFTEKTMREQKKIISPRQLICGHVKLELMPSMTEKDNKTKNRKKWPNMFAVLHEPINTYINIGNALETMFKMKTLETLLRVEQKAILVHWIFSNNNCIKVSTLTECHTWKFYQIITEIYRYKEWKRMNVWILEIPYFQIIFIFSPASLCEFVFAKNFVLTTEKSSDLNICSHQLPFFGFGQQWKLKKKTKIECDAIKQMRKIR